MTLELEQVAHTNNTIDSANDFVEPPFRPEGFLQVQRNTGYDPYTATADLVDNCIDARATKVWIDVEPSRYKKPEGGYKYVIDQNSTYYIADNGCGMDAETLLGAMSIGSNGSHDTSVDLGVYGIGLKQSCLALGKTFTIVTKCVDGPIISSTFSCDKIIAAGKLVVSRPKLATPEESQFFVSKTEGSNSGTIVIMKELDAFGLSDPKTFKSTLKGPNKLGRVFRFMMKGNLEIYVGRTKVEPADPVRAEDEKSICYTNGWKKLDIEYGGIKGSISYRITKHARKSSGEGKTTHRDQGVIWIRNNREIKSGIDHRFWKPVNETYGLWTEIRFCGKHLDKAVKLTTRKDNVDPDQKFMDALLTELSPTIKTIKNQELAKKKEESKTLNNIQSELIEYCDDVKRAQKLLDCPKVINKFKAENIGAGSKTSSKDKKSKNGKPSLDPEGNIVIKSNSNMEFEFSLCPYGKTGILYQPDQEGNILKVMVNEDHAFVAKNLIESSEESSKAAVKNMLMALALAELQVPDEYQKAFEDFMYKFNHNLRILTSEV